MPGSTVTDEREHHKRLIREASEAVIAATAMLEVRVIAARADGMSWYTIADGLGTSRQAATERFAPLVEAEKGVVDGT